MAHLPYMGVQQEIIKLFRAKREEEGAEKDIKASADRYMDGAYAITEATTAHVRTSPHPTSHQSDV